MAKTYTAQEMRELADKIWNYETMPKGLELCDNELEQVDCKATQDLIGMLRQAADMMDREESFIESRLGRAEKRLCHSLANELFDCVTWSVKDGSAVFANAERVGAIQRRLRKQADDIESKWENKMTKKNETVEQVCSEMRGREWDSPSFDAYAMQAARKFASDWADRIHAAYKHEIDAKDEEITKLRSLVSNLAEELETQVDCDDNCSQCEDKDYCPTAACDWRKLIAKAREAAK